jgi:hypothetical protein
MAYKTFLNGYPLPASELNTYFMGQVVATFANASDRSAAITSPQEGQVTYLEDQNKHYYYNGSAWTELVTGVTDVAGKNKIINGGFDFWQRGTSFSTSGYTADRWFFSYGGTVALARESSIVPTGSTYSAKVTTGASSSFGEIYNAFESSEVNLIAGSTITVSASVRAQASFSGSAVIAIQTNTTANTQTGGTWTEVAASSATPSTGSFGRISVSYTVPAGTQGLRVRLAMASAQASGTGLYWGNVQLEAGSVATPFSRAAGTLQGELAACQRYYQRITAETAYGHFASGIASSSTLLTVLVPLKVTMRVAPTSLDYGGTIGVNDTTILNNISSAALGGDGNSNIARVQVVSTGMTTYRMTNLLGNNSATAYIGFSSEL